MFTLHMVPSDSDTKLKLVHCQHSILDCAMRTTDATLCAHNLQALLPMYLICSLKKDQLFWAGMLRHWAGQKHPALKRH